MIRRQLAVVATLGTCCLWGAASCSSSDSPGVTTPVGGSGGSVSSAGASGSVAAGNGGAGVAGASGSASGGASSGAGGGGAGGTGGTAGSGGVAGANTAGSGGAVGLGGGTHTPPTCAKNTPEPNPTRPSECDFLLQSLDFEDTLGYASTPAQVKLTSFGQAFGLSAINSCSPYCYSKNLTVGIDIVGGSSAQTQGEIIIEFPTTGNGLPITTAVGRDSLAWITFDGAAKPPFEIDTQMVLETSTGIIPAVQVKQFFKTGGNSNPFGPFNVMNDYSFSNGSEFKYFGLGTPKDFPTAPTNVTGMGFRIVAKATAGQEWHGVAYIDHLQIRTNAASKDPPGTYPYGLN